MAKAAAKKGKKAAADNKRPAQIVVTMNDNLKKAVYAKCEATGLPAARAIRDLLAVWVKAPTAAPAPEITAAPETPAAEATA